MRSNFTLNLFITKMATEDILSDVGTIYRRLFNHRPVIQNEVHHFVKEFEAKRGDDGLHSLQASMRMSNEIDAIYLEDMKAASPQFMQIKEKVEEITELANKILQEECTDLGVPSEVQEQMAREVEECRNQLQEEQERFEEENSKEKDRLKGEIGAVRAARGKMRTSSLGSSVTLSMSSTPQLPPSPDGEGREGESPATESTSEEEILQS